MPLFYSFGFPCWKHHEEDQNEDFEGLRTKRLKLWVKGGAWVWSWVAHLMDVGLNLKEEEEKGKEGLVRFWKRPV